MAVTIIAGDCIGCGNCVAVCSFDALSLNDGIAVVNPDLCLEKGPNQTAGGELTESVIIIERKKIDHAKSQPFVTKRIVAKMESGQFCPIGVACEQQCPTLAIFPTWIFVETRYGTTYKTFGEGEYIGGLTLQEALDNCRQASVKPLQEQILAELRSKYDAIEVLQWRVEYAIVHENQHSPVEYWTVFAYILDITYDVWMLNPRLKEGTKR